MKKITELIALARRQPRWRWAVAAVVVLGLAVLWFGHSRKPAGNIPTFAARRGPLDITVLEGGSLRAEESQEIKCEVRVGYQGTKILRIVDEGYLVTEDDVRTNKVLVELDSSDIQKQIVQQEIEYQSALANLTDAQQNYEIQIGQNESDVKTAEQKARFARMDFDKLLGENVTETLIAESGLDQMLTAATTNNVELTANATQVGNGLAAESSALTLSAATGTNTPAVIPAVATTATSAPADDPPASPTLPASPAPTPAKAPTDSLVKPKIALADIDFSQYANLDALGNGEAKQKLRKFDDDLQTAQKELGQAQTTLDGTRRLFDKGFVAKNEITRDELSFDSARLKVQTAETARDLYLKYDFRKDAEQAMSTYAEDVRELDKARRVAISKLAQARARLNSARGQYEVQLRQRNDLQEQLGKCTLVAQKSGLVVYGNGRDDGNYYGDQEPIREGATVRERQTIITIPDMTHMAVNVKIHESYIKKIKKGQKARITVDAFPDQVLTGEITKVGVLPDSQNRWMNPDLKVYITSISIDGAHDWVKPGMSAKVEILVNHLDNVLYIPIQAVQPENGKQYCYVAGGFHPERREVEVGEFNDEFIEIKSGLKAGDKVTLQPPPEATAGAAEFAPTSQPFSTNAPKA